MKNPKISIIVATGKNREIGAKNKLLWKIPEELKRFKEITTGHPIIMGRKTHESIGRVLPNRINIIITRDSNYQVEGALIAHSLEEAIKIAQGNVVIPAKAGIQAKDNWILNQVQDDNEIFIIGGGEIFEQALPLADKLYLTLVDAEFPEADSFFPEYKDKFNKKVSELDQESAGYKQSLKTSEEVFKYKFLELEI